MRGPAGPEGGNVEQTRARAKQLTPALIVTLLSIVQALCLEVLWSSVRDHAFLWEGGVAAVVGWLQVAISFQGIIVLWIVYLGLVVRFVWTPRILDMVVPFILGIFEFVLASLLDPEWLVYWLLTLAGMFVFGTLTNANIFKLVATQPENREHFEGAAANPQLYGFVSLYGPLSVFVALILCSAWLVASLGPHSYGAIAGLVLTNLVLVLQFLQVRFYWNRALFHDDAT